MEVNPRSPLSNTLATLAGVAVVLLAISTLAPLWLPLSFALWTAALLDPLAQRITRFARGRTAVGAAVATLSLLLLIVPAVIALTSVASSGASFVRQVLASQAGRQLFESVVSAEAAEGVRVTTSGSLAQMLRANIARVPELAREHGGTAWRAASGFAGAGAVVVLTVFVFFIALYSFLDSGRSMWSWVKRHAPLREETSDRLAKAFLETGRGLMVGAGLTALTQALLATVIYAALGVPRVLVLGLLTFVCAFVPAVGTAVVWLPVAVGLALKGSVVKAVILALVGGLGISSIDNVVRPFMQRWGGDLELPAFVLMLAAFGGLAMFGAKGLVLGPLAMRMAAEVLAIARESQSDAQPQSIAELPSATDS